MTSDNPTEAPNANTEVKELWILPEKKATFPVFSEHEAGALVLMLSTMALCFLFIATFNNTWLVQRNVENTDVNTRQPAGITPPCNNTDVRRVCTYNANWTDGFKLGLTEWCHHDYFLLSTFGIITTKAKGQCYPISSLFEVKDSKDAFLTTSSGALSGCSKIQDRFKTAYAWGIIGGISAILGVILLAVSTTVHSLLVDNNGELKTTWVRLSGAILWFASLGPLIQFSLLRDTFNNSKCNGRKFFGKDVANSIFKLTKSGDINMGACMKVSIVSFVFLFISGFLVTCFAECFTPDVEDEDTFVLCRPEPEPEQPQSPSSPTGEDKKTL